MAWRYTSSRILPPVTKATRGSRLTIDKLAQQTGMTVRNIRAHQSRGLLPPPDVRGRTGYYGDEHVARIREVQTSLVDEYKVVLIATSEGILIGDVQPLGEVIAGMAR